MARGIASRYKQSTPLLEVPNMDQLADKPVATDFAAEAFLSRLAERGIEYVFANAGTDFAPIIEAVSRNSGGRKYPRFITAPHENLAMAMANGYYRIAGK